MGEEELYLHPEGLLVELPEHGAPGLQLGPELGQLGVGPHHVDPDPALAQPRQPRRRHLPDVRPVQQRGLRVLDTVTR